MIELVVDFLKQVARPSSVSFLATVLAVGVALAFVRRTQRYARWYFAAVLAFYWIGTSAMFIEPLIGWQGAGYFPIATAADARGSRTVVVLGAGSYTIRARTLWLNELPVVAALRVIEGARLYALLDHPTVIVSGGITSRDQGARPEAEAMRAAMLQLGVASEHIVVETESKNTRDEAIIIARMLSGRASQPIVLVTSPTHMKRSIAVFRRAGLDVIPSAAPFKPDRTDERLRWMPSDTGLWLLDTAVYDFAATAYYSLRGWTALP